MVKKKARSRVARRKGPGVAAGKGKTYSFLGTGYSRPWLPRAVYWSSRKGAQRATAVKQRKRKPKETKKMKALRQDIAMANLPPRLGIPQAPRLVSFELPPRANSAKRDRSLTLAGTGHNGRKKVPKYF